MHSLQLIASIATRETDGCIGGGARQVRIQFKHSDFRGQFNWAPHLFYDVESTRMKTTRRHPICLRSAALLLAATGLFSARPIPAEILWRGDFETGTTEQWRVTATNNAHVKVVTEPVSCVRPPSAGYLVDAFAPGRVG
jgi:hypothetical protein